MTTNSENSRPIRDLGLDEWPVCEVIDSRGDECGEEFHPKRAALGYVTCLKHSAHDPMNRNPPKIVVADVSKSNPTVTRNIGAISPIFDGHEGQSTVKNGRFMKLTGGSSIVRGEAIKEGFIEFETGKQVI